MRRLTFFSLFLLLGGCASSRQVSNPTESPQPAAAADAVRLEREVATLAELDRQAGLAWYDASVTGSDEAFQRSREAADAVNAFLSDGERFAWVRQARERAEDPVLRRQLDVLWRGMLGKQVDPELLGRITALESRVEQAFNTYRARIDGRELTQNALLEILRTSTDSAALQAAWEGQKAVGPVVATTLTELVSLRNEVARGLGFRDFFALRLAELDLEEAPLMALFDELDTLTRGPFLEAKAEVDRRLAARLGLGTGELMPWHYQNPFFQEPPAVFETGLDAAYRAQDTLALCRTYYEGIGLEVEDVIARSDLYEKPGKTPHAFAIHVDREDDVRVLANIVPGQDWQTTMVHELGHAVYDVYLDRGLPWLLRSAAHPLTTEGVAMMMDRLVSSPDWAGALHVLGEDEVAAARGEAAAERAFAALAFSRWTQVMLRFERALYADPEQDLNRLWWDLVERYQALHRPPDRDAPDYASKIHVVIVPVYYQNYMLGELFSAQLHERLAEVQGVAPTDAVYVGDPKVGQYLKREVFAPGARYPWPELVERATGRALGAEAFARRFGG